jgi:integrase
MAGQLIKRGGAWLVRVYLGRDEETGKRRYHNKTIHGRKKDAQAYLNKALRERDTGDFTEPSRESLSKYLDRWLETAAKPSVRPRTFADYEGIVRRYLKPELGSYALGSVSPVAIQALYTKMMAPEDDGGMGLSARSVRYAHAVLHRALQKAVKWRLISRNPAADVVEDLPRLEEKEMAAWGKEEARRFLAAARSRPADPAVVERDGHDPNEGREDRWLALWTVLLSTGLRPGEALALKWTDLEGNNLRIRRTLVRRGGAKGWRFEEPKTDRSRRVVSLPASTVDALRRHRVRQAEEKLAAGVAYEDQGLIFATSTGAPPDQTTLSRRYFRPLLELAGLPRVRMYDLRHSAATLLLVAGVHPKIVSERLGHSTITLTIDTYSHVMPHMQEEAAAKIEAMLG